MELTVMKYNTSVVAFYEKMGFVREGYRVNSLIVNGHYGDELQMSKIYKISAR